MTHLMDPKAILAPLLAASPGSSVISTCGVCAQRIDGLVEVDERGFIRHPGECPPPPPPRVPEGMLL